VFELKRKSKIILFIIIPVVGIAIVGFVFVMKNIESNLEEHTAVEIQNIDVSSVPDGKYSGSYSSFPVSTKVEVTVCNHEIVDI
jgi:uncharacterized protein with FMN-binding domain